MGIKEYSYVSLSKKISIIIISIIGCSMLITSTIPVYASTTKPLIRSASDRLRWLRGR